MLLETLWTLLLGSGLCWVGSRFGHVLLNQGVTANDLFKGKSFLALAFLGGYVALVVVALNVPQMQLFPLEWRVQGMRVTWTALRVLLLGACGVAWTISWHTARVQVLAVVLLGLLGVGGFSAVEAYVLAPIYPTLQDNLRPNGVFKQTSNSSCAPAALATVLRRWGLEATESSVARLAQTSRLGTSMPQLIVALRSLGLDGVELSPTWEQMQQINRPGVLAVWLFNGLHKAPHAVALLGLSDEIATIADPARGRIYQLNRQQFADIWRQQYVPVFRPAALSLSLEQVKDYLTRLGYTQPMQISQGIEQFQQAMGVRSTGNLDPQTALLLQGDFLNDVPTLALK